MGRVAMKTRTYCVTRFTTLIPSLIVPKNPITLFRMLNHQQTAFFLVAFLTWTLVCFGFFAVAVNVTEIAKTYDRSTADITWGITVTLMLRCVGAVPFGAAGDRFGRKWPLILNIVFYAVTGIVTGFCKSYTQFIVARAFYGIAMGGIYGNCAAIALEDTPAVTRGLLSGLLQQGYSLGYLLVSALNFTIINNQSYGWRAVFWFGGCLPLFIAGWYIFLPETQAFLRIKEAREVSVIAGETRYQVSLLQAFLDTIHSVFVYHWPIFIYLTLMMGGFNFLAHSSQALYPTFLVAQVKLSHSLITITLVVANCGAFIGGIIIGYCSNIFGRRFSIIVVLIIGFIFIPAYVLPQDGRIMVGAFIEQLCVEGAWGVVPIHLIELAPVQFRSFVVGTVYELGNFISSPSGTIVAAIAEHFPLLKSDNATDKHQYNYGKAMAIVLVCVYMHLLVIIFLGPENKNIDELTESNSKHIDLDEEDNEMHHETSSILEMSQPLLNKTEKLEN